jgi:hypothetical protein
MQSLSGLSDAGLHPQAHSVNVLEGESLAAFIHEGGAWGESRVLVSERREACTSLSPGR